MSDPGDPGRGGCKTGAQTHNLQIVVRIGNKTHSANWTSQNGTNLEY